MTAELRQLRSIKAADFRILIMGEEKWLCLIKDNTFTSALEFDERYPPFSQWIKEWNTETLSDLNLSNNASFVSEKLSKDEIRKWNGVQQKMEQAKMYALNYWENKVFDKLK